MHDSEDDGDSDDEGYETVATPFKARYMDNTPSIPSVPSTPASPPSATQEATQTTLAAQSCTDTINAAIHGQSKSPSFAKATNPFQPQSPESRSPSIEISYAETSPIDPAAHFAYESNRLESFRKHNCQRFAQFTVEELAYAGFYLNAEGTAVKCPWCIITLNEGQIERILRERPSLPDPIINDEPWTAMRVHRHEIGQHINRDNAWCPWVRREYGGLFPNVMMVSNFLNKLMFFSSKTSVFFFYSRNRVECIIQNILHFQE